MLTLDQIIALAPTLAVVVGGFWGYFQFLREDPLRPRIEFDLECTFFGPQNDVFVASFVVYAHNTGKVEHKFPCISVQARGIKTEDPMTAWEGHGSRLYFPHDVFQAENLVHKNYDYFFVRPGVNQAFSFVTTIPVEFRFILARATFKYEAGGLQTAERVFEVASSQQKGYGNGFT